MSEDKVPYGNKQDIELAKMHLLEGYARYIELFEKKHDVVFEGWIGNQWGGVLEMNDYILNFLDIVLDIDEGLPERLIFEWYDYVVEQGLADKPLVNLWSYWKGARNE